jgi:hypothetical protein
MDTDVDIKFSYFSQISIRRYSRYRTVWITCDTSRCKFQRRCKLIALLPDENMTCRLEKIHTAVGTAFQTMC